MTAAGYAVTGPTVAGDSTDGIRAGRIGGLLNLVGAEPVREMQRLPAEESRQRRRKVALGPGQSGQVSLSLPAKDLRFLGVDLQPLFEPGEVESLVGPCAERSRLLLQTVMLAG
jgi:hypothetical protein